MKMIMIINNRNNCNINDDNDQQLNYKNVTNNDKNVK